VRGTSSRADRRGRPERACGECQRSDDLRPQSHRLLLEGPDAFTDGPLCCLSGRLDRRARLACCHLTDALSPESPYRLEAECRAGHIRDGSCGLHSASTEAAGFDKLGFCTRGDHLADVGDVWGCLLKLATDGLARLFELLADIHVWDVNWLRLGFGFRRWFDLRACARWALRRSCRFHRIYRFRLW
jgi:hypothetical protein